MAARTPQATPDEPGRTPPAPAEEPGEPAGAEPATPPADDDVKRQFREALDRKHGRHSTGEAHTDAESPVQHAHGPAAAQRTFRRKSG